MRSPSRFGLTLLLSAVVVAAPPTHLSVAAAEAPARQAVVLVHGTWSSSQGPMADLATRLRTAGYDVHLPDYGRDESTLLGSVPNFNATGDIAESAREIARYIDVVRTTSGDDLVDIVGHSQGGLVARRYLGFEGGAGKINTLVTLGSPHHGTTMHGLSTAYREVAGSSLPTDTQLGVAAAQMSTGSQFLAETNSISDTVPGVEYTVIATRFDQVVTPPESTFLAGEHVTNIWVQDGDPGNPVEHTGLPRNRHVQDLVVRALRQ